MTVGLWGHLPAPGHAGEPGAVANGHPVLEHGVDAGKAGRYERAVAGVMAMEEAEMLRLVPSRSAIRFCGCPNCSGGQQESEQFLWTIERPFELRCRFCGHVFPSRKYPCAETAQGQNALGEKVTYHYYFDAKTGRDYWLEARADYLRRDWFVGQCLRLAEAYRATGKSQYARRAALILDRFAESYPHMAVLRQWPYRRRGIERPAPPYPLAGGKWGRWMESEIPSQLPEAYDLIYDSPELDRLGRERGVDVRRRIEHEFFAATVEYTLTFQQQPEGIHFNNMAPFYVADMIRIGRVIDRPEYVRWGSRWLENFLRDRFFVDGMWHEAPSYHFQVVGGIQPVMALLSGAGNAPGPQVEAARHAAEALAYPNGYVCPLHDTWANSHRMPARRESSCTLLPGWGHAALGSGSGVDQIQAHFQFSASRGHRHADNLSLAMFAKGGEILGDIGYTHSKLRRWATSTISHNTVAIDRKDQTTEDADGDLLLFVPEIRAGRPADSGGGGLESVVEARGERGYAKLAECYCRQLLLVRVGASQAYVVDVFRVRGGTTHDWLLHGSASEDMTAASPLPMAAQESLLEGAEKWVEPVGESSVFHPYGLFREIRHGRTDGWSEVTFRYLAGRGPTAGAGLRSSFCAGPAEVFLARTPRVRQAEGDDRKAYEFWMPQLMVRRRAAAALGSVFLAVHEPFRGEPFLDGFRSLAMEPAAEGCVAFEVRHGAWTDTIISTLDEPPYPERRLPGGIVFQGRLGFLRQHKRQVVEAVLVEGTGLRAGDVRLTSPVGRWEGSIESASRRADGAEQDAFLTAATLPAGEALKGRWMIVTHGDGHTHGYAIDHVERRGGKSQIVLQADPGLKVAEGVTEECFFPRRKIAGTNRFVIPALASIAHTSPRLRKQVTCTSTGVAPD
jgi:hypothetical protein